MTLLGVISDTHGLLRPEALDALRGSELIIHAGDVGKPEILERLRQIAPVVAVRGNVDTTPWAEELPETQVVRVVGRSIYVLHDRSRLVVDPVTAGYAAVVFGHPRRLLALYHRLEAVHDHSSRRLETPLRCDLAVAFQLRQSYLAPSP
jgi:putative phosphoesterase